MRKALFLGLLAATTLAAPVAAVAQDGGGRNRAERQQQRAERQQQRQQQQAERREQRQERQVVRPQTIERQQRAVSGGSSGPWVGNPNDPARARYERLERQNAREYGTREQYRDVVQRQREERVDRREDRRDWRQDRREDRRDWRQDRRQDRRAWNRDWRRDQRYDWRRFRDTNRFVFHIGPYYAPYRGYGYSRFSVGMILDQLFWGRNYWIADPWTYRLPPAGPGYQWVRYYNDVLLVDTWTGRVVDVIYDFFW